MNQTNQTLNEILLEISIEELEDRVEFSLCQGICFSDAGIPESCVQPYVEL